MTGRRPAAFLVLVVAASAACTATPGPTGTARPEATPELTPAVTPPPPPSPSPEPFGGALPLPRDLGPDAGQPAGEVAPTSIRSMVPGGRMLYTLGHCGLYSPVDLDGSLWEPIGAIDAEGGPVDSDAEVGDLINATSGTALLVSPIRLQWRADPSRVVVVFDRLPGSRQYPGCQ